MGKTIRLSTSLRSKRPSKVIQPYQISPIIHIQKYSKGQASDHHNSLDHKTNPNKIGLLKTVDLKNDLSKQDLRIDHKRQSLKEDPNNHKDQAITTDNKEITTEEMILVFPSCALRLCFVFQNRIVISKV